MGYIEFTGGDVALMICSKCNIACKHCYIGYDSDWDPQDLLNTIYSLKEKFVLSLNGSEPILNTEYLKAYKAIGQDHILSNGLAFYNDNSLFDKLKEYGIREIGISYHFNEHKRFSAVPEEKVLAVLNEAKKRDFYVTVNCTITVNNYTKVLSFCDVVHEMGFDRIHFTNYMDTGLKNVIKNTLVLNDCQKREFFRQLSLARAKYDKNVLNITRCGTFEKDNYTFKDNFFCGIGEYGLAISPEKKVYPCIFLVKKGEEIGYMEDDKIFIRDDFKLNKDQCLVHQKCCKKDCSNQ